MPLKQLRPQPQHLQQQAYLPHRKHFLLKPFLSQRKSPLDPRSSLRQHSRDSSWGAQGTKSQILPRASMLQPATLPSSLPPEPSAEPHCADPLPGFLS